MSTIPASAIVQVLPGVVGAGGTALVMNGLFLTTSTKVPVATVESLASAQSVADLFGATSPEAKAANVYFKGFLNSTKLPASMLFSQYTASAVAGYLRSGNITALGLAAIQAMSGSLTLTVDGYPHVIASINLSAATSYSSAAALLTAALSDPTECSFTGSISGAVLTVTGVISGTLSVGQTITDGGVNVPAGTIITALGTGTGLTGDYAISTSASVGSQSMTSVATMPVVSFDSVTKSLVVTSGITGVASSADFATGTLAASLLMTETKGAILSQGADATDPLTFMEALVQTTQNWATFTTIFDPDNGSGNTEKLAFGEWTNDQNNRYGYVCWDSDQSPVVEAPALQSLGYLMGPLGRNYSGICLVTDPQNKQNLAAFIMGFTASLDWQALNGRATLAFKSQNGLSATCNNLQQSENLIANGYNFYGAYATANQNFLFMYPGSINGPFLWFDSYVNQIWLNAALQLALLELLTYVKSIPYNAAGYALLEAACMDPINQAINFGAIRVGVSLSEAQTAEINNNVGKAIDKTLSQRGWYLDIKDATAQVRAARQSPPMVLYYMDGQSIQQITLSSLDVL